MSLVTTHPFDDDHLHEECAVFGIYGTNEASINTALGLHALQHRAQLGRRRRLRVGQAAFACPDAVGRLEAHLQLRARAEVAAALAVHRVDATVQINAAPRPGGAVEAVHVLGGQELHLVERRQRAERHVRGRGDRGLEGRAGDGR